MTTVKVAWSNWLSRHPLKVEIAGSNPVATTQERQTDKA